MWPEPYSICNYVLAVLTTAIAVKFMDDMVDGEETTLAGLTTAGAGIYAMALLAVGTALAPAIALPLFAAAYAVGMLQDPHETLPSGMPAWMECALAIMAAAVICGVVRTLHALLVVAGIQLLDDLIDYAADLATPGRNSARRIGRVETALLAAICFVWSTIFGWVLAVVAAGAYLAIRLLEPRRTKGAGECCN